MGGRMVPVLALVAGLTLSAGGAHAREQIPGIRALQGALVELDGVVATLEGMKRSRGRERAMQQVAEARTRLVEGLAALMAAGHRDPASPVEPPCMKRAGPSPMDADRFADLLARLQALSFSKDQLAYLDDVVRTQYVTTEQVRRVMRVFSFDSDKVKAAATMYPVVLDKADFHTAQQELSFESDRERLRAEVRRVDASGLDGDREDR